MVNVNDSNAHSSFQLGQNTHSTDFSNSVNFWNFKIIFNFKFSLLLRGAIKISWQSVCVMRMRSSRPPARPWSVIWRSWEIKKNQNKIQIKKYFKTVFKFSKEFRQRSLWSELWRWNWIKPLFLPVIWWALWHYCFQKWLLVRSCLQSSLPTAVKNQDLRTEKCETTKIEETRDIPKKIIHYLCDEKYPHFG